LPRAPGYRPRDGADRAGRGQDPETRRHQEGSGRQDGQIPRALSSAQDSLWHEQG